ncbi:MAG: hypothetical protein H0X30_22390 [Anaerolineae bacterium]|nr:hypothetical protein [Anaerolineae bacterium]
MYDPPIIKNGIKIYRLSYIFRRRSIQVFVFAFIVGCVSVYALSLNDQSSLDNALFFAVFGVFVLYLLWIVYQSFIFRLELTERGGTIYGLGKTVQFDWPAVDKVDYVNWLDENLNLNELCIWLNESTETTGFWLPSKYFFPCIFNKNRIPVSTLYHRKSFWSLSVAPERPEYGEYQSHLYRFLNTEMGHDMSRYIPHALSEVITKYLPDNNMND